MDLRWGTVRTRRRRGREQTGATYSTLYKIIMLDFLQNEKFTKMNWACRRMMSPLPSFTPDIPKHTHTQHTHCFTTRHTEGKKTKQTCDLSVWLFVFEGFGAHGRLFSCLLNKTRSVVLFHLSLKKKKKKESKKKTKKNRRRKVHTVFVPFHVSLLHFLPLTVFVSVSVPSPTCFFLPHFLILIIKQVSWILCSTRMLL